MKILTTRFGELEVNEESLITFTNGIPGLEQYTTYCLLPADEENESPFFFLQSTEESSLCFILADSFSFYPDYEIHLEENLLKELSIEEPRDAMVLSVLTVQGSLQDATMNLKAPIILNLSSGKGKQIVLSKDFQIKAPLVSAVEGGR
ncbi:flagellar assembly protein FliW [Guptibacillus algicola]|uniref:flagellar assembly protein FliW n=1 Tax=Guptibacillus algicola TaxID=225844 RepID=UPI001CD33C2F|nr:flagellar assembly protein FliW [Alkalihalobacillus algicola]MCA0988886.1 flagellar assembly protein FliW [Alkalihalobacillus algicola]